MRRIRVSRSASGEKPRPFASSFSSKKASTGLRTGPLVANESCVAHGWNRSLPRRLEGPVAAVFRADKRIGAAVRDVRFLAFGRSALLDPRNEFAQFRLADGLDAIGQHFFLRRHVAGLDAADQ